MSTILPGISRAHTELLGIQPQTPYPEPETLEHIHIPEAARYSLIRQMYLTGQWQGGVVFGEREDNLLTLMHFAPNGPRFEQPDSKPFTRNTNYLLGYADAMIATYYGQVDWAGHWLVRPNSQVMMPQEELHWLQDAHSQGLVDSQTPLLTAGYRDGELDVNAYKAVDDQLIRLSVSF